MERKEENWVNILEHLIASSPVQPSQPIDVSIATDDKYEEFFLKIILAGDGAVGKTAIRERYLGHGFPTQYLPTLGADFSLKNDTLGVKELKFQIWDLAGQPKYEAIRKLYY